MRTPLLIGLLLLGVGTAALAGPAGTGDSICVQVVACSDGDTQVFTLQRTVDAVTVQDLVEVAALLIPELVKVVKAAVLDGQILNLLGMLVP